MQQQNNDTAWLSRNGLQIVLILIGLAGQTIWIGQRFGALESEEQFNQHRIEGLETNGSPVLGQMRVAQEADIKRLDTTQEAVTQQQQLSARFEARISVLESQIKYLAEALGRTAHR